VSADRKIVFITGTDTGVGKTVVTASLLHYLRSRGARALAMKPFCSGSRDDVELLQAVQKHEIEDQEVNPFFFREPLAPVVAARRAGRKQVTLDRAMAAIERVALKCDRLLIEGAGGLLAPLGPNLTALDLILDLKCSVCIVAANKLGAINHSLLTVRALPMNLRRRTKLILNDVRRSRNLAARTNLAVLSELLAPMPVVNFPYVARGHSMLRAARMHARKLRSVLDMIL
jgi:dethiobiotin synthetase